MGEDGYADVDGDVDVDVDGDIVRTMGLAGNLETGRACYACGKCKSAMMTDSPYKI